MLAAIGDAKTCPHGHPIQAGSRIEGVPLADVEVGATVTILRFENEAEDLLHYLKRSGLEPGLDGTVGSRSDDDEVVVDAGGDELTRHAHASPRPCRWSPTRRRRRASRCPSSSSWRGDRYGR